MILPEDDTSIVAPVGDVEDFPGRRIATAASRIYDLALNGMCKGKIECRRYVIRLQLMGQAL